MNADARLPSAEWISPMPSLVIDAPAVPLAPVAGLGRGVSGAPGLLHRPQLCRARRSRWATTPTASRRSSSRRTRTTSISAASFPTRRTASDVHHEIELVVALGKGGGEHPGRAGARPRLGLRRRARHDPARPAGHRQGHGPALEIGKAFERSAPMGALRPASEIGHPRRGPDRAQGQRRGAAGGRPQPDDLEGARDDRLPVRLLRARRRATSS